jgi:hypothetical protein
VRQRFLNRKEDAFVHDVVQFIEHRFRQHIDWCELRYSCVCDQYVDLAELLRCFGKKPLKVAEILTSP